MLAGDSLRLRVLSVSSCRNDHRAMEELRIKSLPRVGGLFTCWCYSKLRGYGMGTASDGRRSPRTAFEDLAGPCRESVIQSVAVCGAAHGIHGASLFFPLRAGCLCASWHHERSLYFERDWRESRLANSAVLHEHIRGSPDRSSAKSGGSCRGLTNGDEVDSCRP